MNEFQALITFFDHSVSATQNEKMLFGAVCSLVTIVERQQKEIERLDLEKQDHEQFYG